MGRIQSDVGLITGINITDTVNKLIELQTQPKKLLDARTADLQARSKAITEVTAITLGVQLAVRRLNSQTLFAAKTATSSDATLLTASADSVVPSGTYSFTPVRKASTQHLLSSGFASRTSALGAGTFSVRLGGYSDQGLELDDLNSGGGVSRGKIKISDRSGASAEVDLRFAQNIDDVLQAINSATGIDVKAEAVGDRIQLTDQSGSTTANLRVQEVGGGTTAAGLGLSGINVAADSATGADVLSLYSGLSLGQLNDGNGVSIRDGAADLNVTFRDGTSLEVDFRKVGHADQKSTGTTTAANGLNAQLKFSSVTVGAAYDGVQVIFTDSGSATQGTETVAYDSNAKTLTFDIDVGATTADDVIAALANNPTASALFTAARATGADGTGLVDLADTTTTADGAALAAGNEQTLGDLVNTLNAADPSRLHAAISGDRIVLTDLTADTGGTFQVTSTVGGTLARDLGLEGTASGGSLTSERLMGGLKTTLLRSLGGGEGLGTLGQIQVTNRNGDPPTTVDLSTAATLDDVISAINNSGAGVKASYNAARNGLQIADSSGGTGSLVIANHDGTNSADKLQIAINSAVTSVNSGSLRKQIVSEDTTLASLNGGQGVAESTILIANSAGVSRSVQFGTLKPETLGDVIDAINALNINVEARFNEAGDGLLLVDHAGGPDSMSVSDVGSGTAAADLRIKGTSVSGTVGGSPAKIIDGTSTFTVTLDSDDTLDDLVSKLNALGAPVSASVFTDSSGSLRNHLSLTSTITGKRGGLLVDSSLGSFKFDQLTAAQDAAILFAGSDGGAGRLLTSQTNTFTDVIDGLDVTVAGASTNAVTITVGQANAGISSAVKLFVDQYNKLRDKIATVDFYNADQSTQGLLFGSSEILRMNSDLGASLTGRYFGVGKFQTLAQFGITVDENGKLTLDQSALDNRLATDSEDVAKFFADENIGFAKKLDDSLEKMVGRDNSLLVNRAAALNRQIEDNSSRSAFLQERLDKARTRLRNQFYQMELAISRIQSNTSAITTLQGLATQAMSSN